MPSQRRLRLLLLVVMAILVSTLFFTSQMRQSKEADTRTLQDFYHKTMRAMDGSRAGGKGSGQEVLDNASSGKKVVGHTAVDHDADGDIDEDDAALAKEMAGRLKAAEQKAKDLANAKAPKPDPPSHVVGVGSSAGGQSPKKAAAAEHGSGAPEKEAAPEAAGSEEDQEVEAELKKIFKKSPVIIFSKSYCPHSKRAKGILLEKYVIDPAPQVVELDLHPLGKQLQARLGEMTGRKTVPNVMIKGKSIGGGDDMAELDRNKGLADKIHAIGGKGIDVQERFTTADKPLA